MAGTTLKSAPPRKGCREDCTGNRLVNYTALARWPRPITTSPTCVSATPWEDQLQQAAVQAPSCSASCSSVLPTKNGMPPALGPVCFCPRATPACSGCPLEPSRRSDSSAASRWPVHSVPPPRGAAPAAAGARPAPPRPRRPAPGPRAARSRPSCRCAATGRRGWQKSYRELPGPPRASPGRAPAPPRAAGAGARWTSRAAPARCPPRPRAARRARRRPGVFSQVLRQWPSPRVGAQPSAGSARTAPRRSSGSPASRRPPGGPRPPLSAP
mmetsp:Transcript_20421/g.48327  ORF Transcript_20421/g.48327 Transcript_20421/m.48327 type:complete len:270 (+) Transcript_20421:112-921(+)